MGKLNDIIEWQEFGSEYRMYIRHHWGADEKVNIRMTFEDVTRDKVTEINIPHTKVKQFLNTVNGQLLSRKYDINV
ncbi:MAG: hypothetical protein A2Y03_06415 [Omnitrophica WOR_2 bacterium GWF2_38_59]|nr:MAG: hypothetical protein A2Y06_07980 [Omnitrophica WOR_2 bacterium GWA2_37_7]OGX26873.1 MAG: hypothetical protein A2Y03_06415 [Omnitrophica WOR_2 bacterium GWF2_38_59]OGX46788.1 MAG: hypothetical protein A2243_07410 [Omnitrophica WOR_2 bacterium RIFOXYA2_FULL_38_17]OGX59241.1 MAG: hypothetical protein A2447_06095 [Omnitrophica WOR_2 bacterium RIFOXYC2_FULL_38_12]OGX60373.1 MAG: hypothetical protein A2306_00690 [Omnitrophica WOR_2 bacterium RIFOXYB2_FULL_38_16]HBG61152.1 hypothetical protei